MKKSTTLITSLILGAMMSVSAFSYGLPVKASAPENKPTNAPKLVNDYENQKDLNSMMMYSVLGEVTINEDDEFVAHGNASAKITVMADPFDGVWDHVNPSLYQAMNIKKDGRDYTDFSNTGTIELGNCNVEGMTVCYDDVMIFNRALNAGEIAGLSTMNISRDRVGFVGFQTRNVTADSYDIRFVSVIDSLDYQEIGYDIVVKNGDTVVTTTSYTCRKVFSKIVAMDYDKTAEELGGQYIFAVGINGFDQMANGTSFVVTPYYKDANGKHSLASVQITNAHSAQPVCEFLD